MSLRAQYSPRVTEDDHRHIIRHSAARIPSPRTPSTTPPSAVWPIDRVGGGRTPQSPLINGDLTDRLGLTPPYQGLCGISLCGREILLQREPHILDGCCSSTHAVVCRRVQIRPITQDGELLIRSWPREPWKGQEIMCRMTVTRIIIITTLLLLVGAGAAWYATGDTDFLLAPFFSSREGHITDFSMRESELHFMQQNITCPTPVPCPPATICPTCPAEKICPPTPQPRACPTCPTPPTPPPCPPVPEPVPCPSCPSCPTCQVCPAPTVCPAPVVCPPLPPTASEEDKLLPPSPPALRLGITANQSEYGIHVPCEWLQRNFGSERQLAELRRNITAIYVAHGSLPVGAQSKINSQQSLYSEEWAVSEHIESRCLLEALAIPCRHSSLRSRCLDVSGDRRNLARQTELSSCPGWSLLAQARLDTGTVRALHEWFSSLPLTMYEKRGGKDYKDQYEFNQVTGAVAALRCRSTGRYGAPFANHNKEFKHGTPNSVWVQPILHALPEEYTEFIEEKCTIDSSKHAPRIDEKSEMDAMGVIKMEKLPWLQPLLPILPTVCSLNSFTRPSAARACLRNKRILAIGDSTTQELLLQLIDFLETPDGEREDDLTRFISESDRTDGIAREMKWIPKRVNITEWNDQPIYYYADAWTDASSCDKSHRAMASRLFSTAFFPTPYLTAWNITLSMRWNPHVEPCKSMEGPVATNTIDMWRETYRFLKQTCLPSNAGEIVQKYRVKPDGTYRNQHEYLDFINSKFPSWLDKNSTEQLQATLSERPKYGCEFGYLDDSITRPWNINKWSLHLAGVPLFDHVLFHMGAHYTNQWRKMKEHQFYSWTPEQFQHTYEHALQMAQQFSRFVVVKETAWRWEKEGAAVAEINQLSLESTIQAQMQLYNIHAEEVRRWNDEVSLRISAGMPPAAYPRQPRRRVEFLPVQRLTSNMGKGDPLHCSHKNLHDGQGEDGIRTPFCYQLVQDWLRIMCESD